MSHFDPAAVHDELKFKAVRSSGKGGQHVNKVSTSVELYFNVVASIVLTKEQKERVQLKLKNRISNAGELMLVSQSERSQLANRKKVTERFDQLLSKALQEEKRRIPTKISKAKKLKRLEVKKRASEKKSLRRKDWF